MTINQIILDTSAINEFETKLDHLNQPMLIQVYKELFFLALLENFELREKQFRSDSQKAEIINHIKIILALLKEHNKTIDHQLKLYAISLSSAKYKKPRKNGKNAKAFIDHMLTVTSDTGQGLSFNQILKLVLLKFSKGKPSLQTINEYATELKTKGVKLPDRPGSYNPKLKLLRMKRKEKSKK